MNSEWDVCASAFLYDCAARGLSKSSIDGYASDLRIIYNRIIPFDTLSEGFLKMQGAITKDDRSNKSVVRLLSSSRSFLRFAKSNAYAPDSLEVNLPKIKNVESIPLALEIKQIAAIFDYVNSKKGIDCVRLSAILEMMYSSGMRISEVLSLKISDVVNSSGVKSMIVVAGKGGKERTVFITDRAKNRIMNYLVAIWGKNVAKYKFSKLFIGGRLSNKVDYVKKNLDFLCKRPSITRQRIFQEIKSIGIAVGIPSERLCPHVLRHSFATHLLNNNMNVRCLQELLGHSSINTTQIYTKVANKEIGKMLLECHPLFVGHSNNSSNLE